MRAVCTIGIDPKEFGWIRERIGGGGTVRDVTGQWRVLTEEPGDVVLVMDEAVLADERKDFFAYLDMAEDHGWSECYKYTKEEWDRLVGLYRAEEDLMIRWKLRWHERHNSYPYFNEDGIVDYARWSKLPEGKRTLVVLKETNGLHGSLSTFLNSGGSKTYHRTWNNVARWVKMILEQEYCSHVSREVLDDTIRNIAAINLKKYAGGSRADKKIVRQEAMLDVDLLKEQIELYQPDLILTGGWGLVSDFVHDEIFHDFSSWYDPRKRKDAERDPNLWYYRTNKIRGCQDTLVVSMPHPNRSAKRWTLELEKVLKMEKKPYVCDGARYNKSNI